MTLNPVNESARVILDNLQAYIRMYREWGLEGVSISIPTGTRTPSGDHEARKPNASGLAELRAEIGDCTRCKLHSGRTRIVFGTGNPQARLMFVGEGPGEDEDRQGQPFVGKAGQLLTRIIEAMGLKREEVYIANVIKCRPPGNRNPEPDEIAACSPFIRRQIEILRPVVICALGTFAAQLLLGTGQKISKLRGRFHPLPLPSMEQIKVLPTYHPAYLLRNPQEKKRVWEDMKLIIAELKQVSPVEPDRNERVL